MPAYDTVLFDNDGVLVHPPAAEDQFAAVRDAFASCGVTDVDPTHVEALTSGVTVDRLTEIATHHGLDPDELWAAREEYDERSQFDAFDRGDRDVYPDVDVLGDLPTPCGVVSTNHHSTVEFVLDRFDLGDHFETYYGREKTVESLDLKKPNTHYLDLALSDLDGDPASTLYVGDSESDVVAAHRAGFDSLFVRRDHNRDVSLSVTPTHETTTLRSLPDLVAGDGSA